MSGLTISSANSFHSTVETLVNRARIENASALNLNSDDLVVSVGRKQGNPKTGELIYSVQLDKPQQKHGFKDNLKSAANALSNGQFSRVREALTDATKNVGHFFGRTQSTPAQAKENWTPFLVLAEQSLFETIKQVSSKGERVVDLKDVMAGIQANVFDKNESNNITKVDIRSLKALDTAVASAQEKIWSLASSEPIYENPEVLYDTPRDQEHTYENPAAFYDIPRRQEHTYQNSEIFLYDKPRKEHVYDTPPLYDTPALQPRYANFEPQVPVEASYWETRTGRVEYQHLEAKDLGENTANYSEQRTLEIANDRFGTDFKTLDELNNSIDDGGNLLAWKGLIHTQASDPYEDLDNFEGPASQFQSTQHAEAQTSARTVKFEDLALEDGEILV